MASAVVDLYFQVEKMFLEGAQECETFIWSSISSDQKSTHVVFQSGEGIVDYNMLQGKVYKDS